MDSVFSAIQPMMQQINKQVSGDKPLSAERQRFIESFQNKMMELLKSELNWEKLKPQYVKMYAETYEQDEVDGLIAFYQSKAGQSFVSKTPALLQKSMLISQGMMQTMLPKLKQIADQAMEQAKDVQ
jgi:uncharacterized protein